MMYILRPDLSDEQVQREISKYQTLLSDYKAEDIVIKNLGKRRLAYPIKKHIDGIYVQVNYSGDGKQVALVERSMRLSEEVIRYLTTKLKGKVTLTPEAETEALPVVTEVTPPVVAETEAPPVVTETEAPPVVAETEASPVVAETEVPPVVAEAVET